VFVPFAGRQRAAGRTAAQLREATRRSLEKLTISPQVEVRLNEARSRFVTVQGAIAAPGVYPIEASTARLAAMIARAGGASSPAERTEIAISRDGVVGRQILSGVLNEPESDIALRSGDRIVLKPISDRFVALGATGVQADIPFSTRSFNLLSAIGAARGLRDFDADPSGVFVMRYEDPALADALLPGAPPPGAVTEAGRATIYRLDMSGPEAFFIARRFAMRDGDALFVSNAPLTELRKITQLFNAVLTPVATADTLPIQ